MESFTRRRDASDHRPLGTRVMAGIRVENATMRRWISTPMSPTSITAHAAGYINQPLEKIVGLQTDRA